MNFRRDGLIIGLALMVSAVSGTIIYSQDKLPASKVHGYADIFQVIEEQSVYELSREEMIALHECILSKAFLRAEISKGTELKNDFSIKSCFKQDKHARYESPAQVRLEQQDREGKFGGIGIEGSKSEDGQGMLIRKLIDGEPAAKSGLLQEGDIITAAGDSAESMRSFAGLSFFEMVDIIRGRPGTAIIMEIVRDGKKLPPISIVREEVKLKSPVEFRSLDLRIGYLRLSTFAKENLMGEDVFPALAALRRDGVNRLIIDLRDNPGGLLNVVLKFAAVFAPAGRMLMTELRGRKSEAPEQFWTESRGLYADWQVVILVNKSSASGAEIVAGVMQIWGFKIFGEKTYGKGSVQSGFRLSDGGVFYLTTDIYYLANGKTPEDGGIVPDVTVAKTAKTPATDKNDPVLEEALKYLKSLKGMN